MRPVRHSRGHSLPLRTSSWASRISPIRIAITAGMRRFLEGLRVSIDQLPGPIGRARRFKRSIVPLFGDLDSGADRRLIRRRFVACSAAVEIPPGRAMVLIAPNGRGADGTRGPPRSGSASRPAGDRGSGAGWLRRGHAATAPGPVRRLSPGACSGSAARRALPRGPGVRYDPCRGRLIARLGLRLRQAWGEVVPGGPRSLPPPIRARPRDSLAGFAPVRPMEVSISAS